MTYRRLLVSGPTFQLGPLRPFESQDSILGTLAEVFSGAGACVAGAGALGASGSMVVSSVNCPGAGS